MVLDIQEKAVDQLVGYLAVIIAKMVVKFMQLDNIPEGISINRFIVKYTKLKKSQQQQ